jgi:hypothetical protein
MSNDTLRIGTFVKEPEVTALQTSTPDLADDEDPYLAHPSFIEDSSFWRTDS